MNGFSAFQRRGAIAEDGRAQGKDTLRKYRETVAQVRKSVVDILDDGQVVALGTVVAADGLVLTKASEVPDGARCRLPDGTVVPADVVGIDPAYDLALLRIKAEGLVPVAWSKTADPPAGTLLAAAGPDELPVTVGIVSIPRRDTPGPHPQTPSRSKRNPPAAPPWLTGTTEQGKGFRIDTSEGNAAAVGIRPGDIVLAIAGSPMPDRNYLRKTVGINRRAECLHTFLEVLELERRHAGERVPVRLLRGGEQMELTLTLQAPTDGEVGFEWLCWNQSASVPPTAITADLPVVAHYECGAPAVGVDGTAIGLIISRFGVTGSFVIPADRVPARLAELREGKPLSGFPSRWARPAAAAPSVQ